jgi:16S rRNA (guanine527-N7)-methyltransferase
MTVPPDIIERLDAWSVSRETRERRTAYVELLLRWNERINLVGRGTASDVWRRHVLDSAQLLPLLPPGLRTLVDLGSGAGLPGLILAILGVPEVHLIDSDQRKCAFLREAARATGTRVEVHARRINDVPALITDVVTARALAPLAELVAYAERFVGPNTICLFLKGRSAAEELTDARKLWSMRARLEPSATDPAAAIVCIENPAREHHSTRTA